MAKAVLHDFPGDLDVGGVLQLLFDAGCDLRWIEVGQIDIIALAARQPVAEFPRNVADHLAEDPHYYSKLKQAMRARRVVIRVKDDEGHEHDDEGKFTSTGGSGGKKGDKDSPENEPADDGKSEPGLVVLLRVALHRRKKSPKGKAKTAPRKLQDSPRRWAAFRFPTASRWMSRSPAIPATRST